MAESVADPNVDGVRLPGIGTLIARGFGWGTLLGGGAGYVLVVLAVTISAGLSGVVLFYALTFFGLVGAVVGALYGLVAGGAVAAALTPFRGRALPATAVRLVSATIGAVTVVVLTTVLFSAELASEADGGTTIGDVLVFYAMPAVAAAAAGWLLAPRLLVAGADIAEHHR